MEDPNSSVPASFVVSPSTIRAELRRVLACPAFVNSPVLSRLFSFLVEEQLAGRGDVLKESYIGHVLYGKAADYDPKVDATVRVSANRLRRKLHSCYQPGEDTSIRIDIVPGSYTPVFQVTSARSHTFERTRPSQPAPRAAGPLQQVRPAGDLPSISEFGIEELAIPSEQTAQLTFSSSDQLLPLLGQGVQLQNRRPMGWLRGSAFFLVLIVAYALYSEAGSHDHATSWTVRPFSFQDHVTVFPAFSPDGTQVAFSMSEKGVSSGGSIYIQRADSDDPVRVSDGEGEDTRPAWSPDQKELAFIHLDLLEKKKEIRILSLADRKVRKLIDLPGDFPWLCEIPRLSWSSDGKSIFTSAGMAGESSCRIVSINIASTTVQAWTTGAAGSTGDLEAALSPDGTSVAFLRNSGNLVSDLYMLDLATREISRITHDASDVLGFCWKRDGQGFVIASRRLGGTSRLWSIDRLGKNAISLTDSSSFVGFPAVSPRTNAIVFTQYHNETSIWRVAADGMQQVIQDASGNGAPQTSPDGQSLAFRSDRTGSLELWTADRNGEHQRKLTHISESVNNPAWSPDGTSITFECRDRGNTDLCAVPVSGGVSHHLTTWHSSQILPAWSRDGQRLYFSSNHSGRWQIYSLRKGASEPTEVTTESAIRAEPVWRGSGLLIAKQSPSKEIDWISDPRPGDPAAPPKLYEKVLATAHGDSVGSWDASPQGLWFVAPAPAGAVQLMEYSLAKKTSAPVASVQGAVVQGDRSISVEPGGRSALLVLQGERGASLKMLTARPRFPS